MAGRAAGGEKDPMGAKELGRRGEEAAAAYLMRRGYRVLERNYRVAPGEIDIIAEAADHTLVFAEVKTRRTTRFGRPSEAVDYRKQQKIITCARWYLQENRLQERYCRFDVIELNVHGEKATIRHIKGAFE